LNALFKGTEPPLSNDERSKKLLLSPDSGGGDEPPSPFEGMLLLPCTF